MPKLIKNILNSKWLLLLAISFTIIIFYLSVSDISDLPKLKVKHEDKYYHFVAYFLLNLIWLFSIIPYKWAHKRKFLIISLLIIAFGIFIEVIQEVVTDIRVFDYLDILANSLGVMLSYLCFLGFKKEFLKI